MLVRHAFKSNRLKKCVEMPGKMARSDLDQAFGLPEVLVAVSTSRLSCKRAGKTRTLMPVWDSSGESQLLLILQEFWMHFLYNPAEKDWPR
jgi:hypothetical protein